MITDIAIIIVQDSKNRLYVHQRKDEKRIFPSLYGLGAGGKIEVTEGEIPLEGAKREIREELGIESKLEECFTFPFTHPIISYTVHVFRAIYNGEIRACKREFKWSGWMESYEIDELARIDKLCPDTKIAYERFKREYLQK